MPIVTGLPSVILISQLARSSTLDYHIDALGREGCVLEQFSNVQLQNSDVVALKFGHLAGTLQRFRESIKMGSAVPGCGVCDLRSIFHAGV